MEYIVSIVALIAGFVIGWLLSRNRASRVEHELRLRMSLHEEKLKDTETENAGLEKKLSDSQETILELNRQLSSKNSDFQNLQQKLSEQKQELENLQEKFSTEFKNIANEILEEKTRRFTLQNKENLDEILKPLGEKIRDFEKKVQDTYEKGVKDQTDLKVELKRLHELSIKLDEDARSLTSALRSDTKKQGNWGEIILERVLERSGLIKNEEYVIQPSVRDDSGLLQRPDVVVNLPENKNIIIDSKVSLVAYDSFSNSESDQEREKFLKQHLESVRSHVKNLSNKSYQMLDGLDAPDFVLLFMPIESAFSLAIQHDPGLFSFAWDRKIVLVSPTTLLATLKTVESIWKHERQTRNANEIARQGGALYDKFVSFLNDLERIGSQLNTLQRTYDEAHKKLSSGKDNLIRKSERLKELGAKTSKDLPNKLMDD
ncbi:MAG: DNA recombination protein RmuC [Bacteroidales bacterium]|nr:DNA recombination protein RmuC [Bacteroidales bacterium]MCF8388168.1 DNA recombination protein RmuC [Bacteroidales bacterium]MCF8399102.1 DNA recombination protein RmuC [Bacteroidales bacterium]